MSRILGLGTDLHKLIRIKNILARNGPLDNYRTKRLSERVLNSVHELPKFQQLSLDQDVDSCAKLLSNSWCVKEAIYKSLDPRNQKQFVMSDWFKRNDEHGRPIIGNHRYFENHPNEQFLCSLSHDGDYVTSIIIRQSL